MPVVKVTFADTPPDNMADILPDASKAALDLLLQLLLWNPGANPSSVIDLHVCSCANGVKRELTDKIFDGFVQRSG